MQEFLYIYTKSVHQLKNFTVYLSFFSSSHQLQTDKCKKVVRTAFHIKFYPINPHFLKLCLPKITFSSNFGFLFFFPLLFWNWKLKLNFPLFLLTQPPTILNDPAKKGGQFSEWIIFLKLNTFPVSGTVCYFVFIKLWNQSTWTWLKMILSRF